MQKHIIIVLSSFFGVILIIMLGTNVAYRTNVIPSLKNDFTEKKLQEKLDEEDRIARQKAQQAEDARIAAQIKTANDAKLAAQKARQAAKKKSSKKSKAS